MRLSRTSRRVIYLSFMKTDVTQRRKRRDGEATRERILAATIELLSDEGLAGISTGKLSNRAGIVQSGFYAHFASVEECTLVAAERIGNRLRELVVQRMREEDTVDPAALSGFMGRMLSSFEGNWKFMEIMLRYRRDPSPLGKVMSRFYDQVREDVVDNLIEVSPLDLQDSERPLLVPAAHMIVLQFVAALEALVEGLAQDPASPATREKLADQLAAHVQLSAEQTYNTVSQHRQHNS